MEISSQLNGKQLIDKLADSQPQRLIGQDFSGNVSSGSGQRTLIPKTVIWRPFYDFIDR